jgi:hypothetical protein
VRAISVGSGLVDVQPASSTAANAARYRCGFLATDARILPSDIRSLPLTLSLAPKADADFGNATRKQKS